MAGVPLRRKRTYNKFHVAAKPDRTWNGIVFASKGEMERHRKLLVLVQTGQIENFERQVPIVLLRDGPDGKALFKWVVDWRYVENEKVVVEDFTGKMTSLKLSKIRICAAIHPDLVIRISHKDGDRITFTDCVKGKLPAKPRKKALVKK